MSTWRGMAVVVALFLVAQATGTLVWWFWLVAVLAWTGATRRA